MNAMPLAITQPDRDYKQGAPVFCLDRGGWFIGSAVVEEDAESAEGKVRISYMVPQAGSLPDDKSGFAERVESIYGPSSVGLREVVDMSGVLPILSLALPREPDDPLPVGSIVVMLREEPYRIQLAEVIGPPSGDGAGLRMIIPVDDHLESDGAKANMPLNTFLTAGQYDAAMRHSNRAMTPDMRSYANQVRSAVESIPYEARA
jgi:hypothetical protein